MSEDQQAFLKDYGRKFRDAKSKGSVTTFYDQFYADWFTKFPEISVVFPNAKSLDDLTKDDQEELKWHVNKKKAVCFNNKLVIKLSTHTIFRDSDGSWDGLF